MKLCHQRVSKPFVDQRKGREVYTECTLTYNSACAPHLNFPGLGSGLLLRA